MNADPQLRDIPVIGMTGGRWKSEDTLGFDALLEKPIEIERLLELLKNVATLKVRHLKADREIHETVLSPLLALSGLPGHKSRGAAPESPEQPPLALNRRPLSWRW
jgi:hypothetical protein